MRQKDNISTEIQKSWRLCRPKTQFPKRVNVKNINDANDRSLTYIISSIWVNHWKKQALGIKNGTFTQNFRKLKIKFLDSTKNLKTPKWVSEKKTRPWPR